MRLFVRLLGCAILVGWVLGTWPQVPVAQVFPEPLVVACGDETHPPDLLPEIRWAASRAASEQIDRGIDPLFDELVHKSISIQEFDQRLVGQIQELEQIAQGSNRQCREVVLAGSVYLPLLYSYHAWAQAYLVVGSFKDEAGFPEEFLRQLKLIIGSTWQAKSFELALSRAMVIVFVFFVAETLPLDAWERVACGGVEAYPQLGLELDGSLYVENNDSQGFPFREVAASEWSHEVWYNSPLGRDRSFLLDKAVHGCTHELRTTAARIYVLSLLSQEEELRTLTLQGGSEELRAAAAAYLVHPFAFNKDLSDEDLQRLALTAETAELKSAAGWALGLRWQRKVSQGQLGLTTSFSFLGPDGSTLKQGNLIQFVAAHTGANPELAQAAILPLCSIFLQQSPVRRNNC